MKKVNINIKEGSPCAQAAPYPSKLPNAHHGEEASMHRTSLAQLHANSLQLIDMIEDSDDLPEWVESKITKAADYISSVRNYLNGQMAREQGALEEVENIDENHICEVDVYFNLYEAVQDAVTEENEHAFPECLYEILTDARCECSGLMTEAKYRGRKVKLNKPMRGDVKKFKVYVRDPKTGNIKKVNFGDKNMRIKKSNPKRRKSFRARHNCKNPGPKTKARYWSCRKW